MSVQYRFDDEVVVFSLLETPFLEGVTNKNTGVPIFKELVWFVVSGVLLSHLCVNSRGTECPPHVHLHYLVIGCLCCCTVPHRLVFDDSDSYKKESSPIE